MVFHPEAWDRQPAVSPLDEGGDIEPLDSRRRAGGFTDWVGPDAIARRRVNDLCLSTFADWGFQLVETPLIEPLETISTALVSPRLQGELFRFMDADGSLLALVAERTVSVARIAATHLQRDPLPLRLCYSGPVLRNRSLLNGRRREELQVGCELLGHGALAADAECIALAVEALSVAGMTDLQVDVGHAGFLPGLIESAGLDSGGRRRVAQALARRDLVGVENALRRTAAGDAEAGLLLRFPALRGRREILDVAAAEISGGPLMRTLEQLGELCELLDVFGIGDSVHVDLGAVRDWNYYTGPTFELFNASLGFPLGSGGRYDSLPGGFGLPVAATGFVIHVDRCCDAMRAQPAPGREAGPVRVVCSGAELPVALALVRRIRSAGIPALCDADPTEPTGPPPAIRVDEAGVAVATAGGWMPSSAEDAVAAVLSARL